VELDLKIFIATHKQFKSPEEECFQPIHAGKKGKKDLGYLGDDTGDSISEKNPFFCELTALYWAWKNNESQYIGLCHYRRYFDIQNNKDHINDIRYLSQTEFEGYRFSKKKIADYLLKFDIILAKPKVYELSVEQIYGYSHSVIDFEILTQTINEMYPEYSESWNKVSYQNNKLIHYNMFITKKEILNEYCGWLFSLLFEVEKRVKISPYDYDKRVFGFMSERLMHLYFTHNQFKIKYLPILYVMDSVFKFKTPSKANKFLSNFYNSFIFFISNTLKYKLKPLFFRDKN
jgi:hypothetical protein